MASLRIIIIAVALVVNGVTVMSQLLEEGYSVTTVIDGNKMGVNPHSILPRFDSSDFVLLDSARSRLYAVSSPISQESVIERLAGNGSAGFADGDLGSSMFNKPKSFAIDLKGNVYVADKGNHVIRKVTSSGVTTIAGGLSKKAGSTDGPAQLAQFSDDFELTFVPRMCALLISDHGNKLVRQIDLKHEDCHVGSHSALGATFTWILGLGVSCILGMISGFIARPYVTSHEGYRMLSLLRIWNLFRINQGKQVVTFCFDIRNAIANSTPYSLLRKFILLNLSNLSLILSFGNVKFKSAHPVSLMDSDVVCSRTDVKQLDQFSSQLKDLIMFDGSSEALPAQTSSTPVWEDLKEVTTSSATLLGNNNHDNLETMIHANLMNFVTKSLNPTPEDSALATSVLVRRRQAPNVHE